MQTQHHNTDLCVIGGGMAGLCAAVAAARHGAQVVLMHDRPVPGGNASSEIRMHICGARGPNMRETGILEEIELENLRRNPGPSYAVWDSVLYEKARYQENLELLLNCTCLDAEMDGDRIKSVTGRQLTTEITHTIEAKYFADCSGDGVLAPMTGAAFRIGREARGEFNESIEPEKADSKTMGMSCLFQLRETPEKTEFIPPDWAYKYMSDADLPFKDHNLRTNFWWIELGGEDDSIHDTEKLRDELLKIAFGVWDHMKNHGGSSGDAEHSADNWTLEWIGFLPGKRESRRYVGDHILTQNDVEAEGRFGDLIAYGGWPMDDHFPAGFYYRGGHPTIYHPAPSPYGIPYRCLYSKNIANLFFAGRSISVTHAALSSTRVMATCAILGQAVGAAAALCVRDGLAPREAPIKELQQALLDDDCYLPWHAREIPALTKNAALVSSAMNIENLRNGIDRPAGEQDNGVYFHPNESATYTFEQPEEISLLRFVFDSDLNRKIKNMPCVFPLGEARWRTPGTLVRDFRVEYSEDGVHFSELIRVAGNCQRLVKLLVKARAKALRFVPLRAWNEAESMHMFAWDVR